MKMKDENNSIYLDPRHYDAMYNMTEDIPFYLDCIRDYGEPVLELACGTGRVTIPLAERKVDITGLDISQEMLGLAKRKAMRKGVDIDLIKGDMRDFTIDKEFNTIIVPVNSMLHLLSIDEYEGLFSSVHEHLSDQGRFIFQIFNPDLSKLTRDPDEEYTAAEYDDPDGGGKILITENTDYDMSEQVMNLTWYYHINGEVETKVDWKLRILFPKEIDALLEYNGFEVEKKYGDFDRSDFRDDSDTQIIICKKEE